MSSSSTHMSSQRGRCRETKPLSATLLEHCTVCLEEQLLSPAFSILSNALLNGQEESGSACLPPPPYLALAATLIVHPHFTTKTDSQDRLSAADDALKYLAQVAKIVHPKVTGFGAALQFTSSRSRTPWLQRSRASANVHAPENRGSSSWEINTTYSGKQSLWSAAEDFWSLIGWAFNCSVVYPARWRRWKLLLELMLEILDDELENSISVAPSGDVAHTDTLIANYLSVVGEGRANKRRVMRAILADGSPKSLAEFGEVWRGETKRKKQENENVSSKRRKLDLENGEFGDYAGHNSDMDSADEFEGHPNVSTPLSTRPKRNLVATPMELKSNTSLLGDGVLPSSPRPASPKESESFGGIESIRLRQKLLSLLVRLSEACPTAFLDNEDLSDLFTEFIRPLPLAVFEHFVLPSKPYLSSDQQASLNEMLFRPMVSLGGTNETQRSITQESFQTRYAIQAATNISAADNAKVCLLTESLLRALWKHGLLESDSFTELADAVNQGIEARLNKASGDMRKSRSKADTDATAKRVMHASAERMGTVIHLLQSARRQDAPSESGSNAT